MINRTKLVIVFLSPKDRESLQRELQILSNDANTRYIEVKDRNEVIYILEQLTGMHDLLVLQIVAHGNCERFGVSVENSVYYSEIANLLRQINHASNGNLILNLMTVCCSIYQLVFFDQGASSLFQMLIGCTKGAFVNGSILHSHRINNTVLEMLAGEIEHINYNINDEYSLDFPETITYAII
jgi:hypothetical protein